MMGERESAVLRRSEFRRRSHYGESDGDGDGDVTFLRSHYE